MNQGLDGCTLCQIGCGDICGGDMGIASSMFITIHACGQLAIPDVTPSNPLHQYMNLLYTHK